jgi:hypothetical protein
LVSTKGFDDHSKGFWRKCWHQQHYLLSGCLLLLLLLLLDMSGTL